MTTDAGSSTQPQANPPSEKMPFPLQEGERVLKLCRRHWVYLWPSILLKLVAAIVPPAIVAFIMSRTDSYEGTAAKVFWIIAAVYLVYWALRILFAWYRYHNDTWVITNQRLVDSRRTNPFNLTVSTADLVNVQDMTVERSGLFRTMFDFGDIVCQTAADMQEFRIAGIPDPRGVQMLVDKERDRERLRYRA